MLSSNKNAGFLDRQYLWKETTLGHKKCLRFFEYCSLPRKDYYCWLLVARQKPNIEFYTRISCTRTYCSFHYIFASLFLSLNRALVKLVMFSISLQKLFLLSRKSNFRILYIQISLRHQMPKHETRNIFYWITWEVNIVC